MILRLVQFFYQLSLKSIFPHRSKTCDNHRDRLTTAHHWTESKEFPIVLDPSQIAQIADTIILPLIGGIALLTAKLSVGNAQRIAERNFFAALIVITAITLRTVITCDEIWLVHTTTLGLMIVGSLVIPSQETLHAETF
jgi:hypothetical protein